MYHLTCRAIADTPDGVERYHIELRHHYSPQLFKEWTIIPTAMEFGKVLAEAQLWMDVNVRNTITTYEGAIARRLDTTKVDERVRILFPFDQAAHHRLDFMRLQAAAKELGYDLVERIDFKRSEMLEVPEPPTECDWQADHPDGGGGHRGEYDYTCQTCGKQDWFARYDLPTRDYQPHDCPNLVTK